MVFILKNIKRPSTIYSNRKNPQTIKSMSRPILSLKEIIKSTIHFFQKIISMPAFASVTMTLKNINCNAKRHSIVITTLRFLKNIAPKRKKSRLTESVKKIIGNKLILISPSATRICQKNVARDAPSAIPTRNAIQSLNRYSTKNTSGIITDEIRNIDQNFSVVEAGSII